jgi:hypothetical protein
VKNTVAQAIAKADSPQATMTHVSSPRQREGGDKDDDT